MFERILIPIFATMLAIAIITVGVLRKDDPVAVNVSSPPWTQATVDNPTGSYRFTVNGWEDTAHWRINGEESKVKFIDQIHPVVWMLFVVSLASGMAVLASNEENVKRLCRIREEECKRL